MPVKSWQEYERKFSARTSRYSIPVNSEGNAESQYIDRVIAQWTLDLLVAQIKLLESINLRLSSRSDFGKAMAVLAEQYEVADHKRRKLQETEAEERRAKREQRRRDKKLAKEIGEFKIRGDGEGI